MESLKEICSRIELQKEVEKAVLAMEEKQEFSQEDKEIRSLTEAENWEKARESLRKSIGEDSQGMKILCCMLKAAAISLEKYREQEIEDRVFNDTMKCFTRFVEEHKVSYGIYGFDRDFIRSATAFMVLTGTSGPAGSFPSSFFVWENWNMKRRETRREKNIFPSTFPQMRSWILRRSGSLFPELKFSLRSRILPGRMVLISAAPGSSARL